jgi:hemin uptake protein HemP
MNPMTKVLRAPPAEQLEDARGRDADALACAEESVLTLESSRILSGREEVAIRHNGRMYRLRCTRLGKLILTA